MRCRSWSSGWRAKQTFRPGAAARRAHQQAHQPPGDGARTSCSNSRRSNAGGVEATKAAFLKAVSRGEWNKADHLFQWLWQNVPRDRGLRSADERGDPEELPRRPLLHVPGHGVARASRPAFSTRQYLPLLMRPVGALCDPQPGRPAEPDALAAAADRRADRGAPAVEAHHCASAAATMRRRRSASSAKPSAGSTCLPKSRC